MSYTEIYQVPEKGEIIEYKEFYNSSRGAMLIWRCMAERYLPPRYDYLSDSPWAYYTGGSKGYEEIWALAKDIRIPPEHRITLISTFDYLMVKRENIQLFADSFRKFTKDFGDKMEHSSLLEQAEALEELLKDKKTYAVCWLQTSVCSDLWQVFIPDELPEDKDDYDEIRNYDISKDDDRHCFFDFKEDILQKNT